METLESWQAPLKAQTPIPGEIGLASGRLREPEDAAERRSEGEAGSWREQFTHRA
jgi:hypothetical protein